MNNDGGKIWFGLGLDNDQLRADAQRSKQIFLEIGNQAEKEGAKIDASIKKAATAWLGFLSMREASRFALSIARVRGEFQQLEVAFNTMLGSKAKADALMAQIVETAAKTPFDLQGVANGAKQLLAYGVASERINETLIRLGNISAGLSIPLGDLVYLYGTTMTQGRLFTQDLRQFMGRGIPLADELAKQFGVTKDQVGELVTAGRVGFPEVQKAIEAMTNEGGKFHNLMEEQSKTITGQISNLEDAWATMLNNIGKSSEGAINTALDGAAYLIEHYREIGRILGVLIGTYGAYKAVVIAYAVAQRMAVSAGNIGAWFELARGIKTAKDAQIALNLAMGANPLIKLASILVTVGGLLWAFAKNSDDAEHSVGELESAVLSECRQVNSLVSQLTNANTKEEERKKILEELKGIQPKIVEGIDAENIAYKNLTERLSKYNDEQIKRIALAKLQDRVGDVVAKQNDAETRKTLAESKASNLIEAFRQQVLSGDIFATNTNKSDRTIQQINEELTKITTSGKSAREQLSAILNMRQVSGARTFGFKFDTDEIEDALDEISDLDKELFGLDTDAVKAQAEVDSFMKNFKSYFAAVEQGGTDVEKPLTKLSDILTNIHSKEKELKRIQDQKSWTDVDEKSIENLNGELKTLREQYKKLTGTDYNKTGNLASQALKKQQSLSYALVQAELDLQEQRIAVMRDGRNKRLAEIDLEYRQIAAKIKKEKEEAQKNGATKDQLSVYDDQITTAEQKRIRDRQRTNKEYAIQIDETYRQLGDVFVSEEARKTRAAERTYQAMRDKALEDLQSGNISGSDFVLLNAQIDNAEAYEQMQDLVDAFGNTQDKITKIQKTAQEARDKAIKNNRQDLLPQIDKQEQEEISKIELDELMKSDDWINLFQNLDVLSQKKIHEIIDKINEQLKNAKLSPIDFKTVVDQLDKAEDTARSKNPFAALARGIPKLKSALATAKKAWADYEKAKGTPDEAKARVAAEQAQIEADKTRLETWQDAQKGAADLSKTMGAVGDMLGKFGVQVPQEVEGVMGALDAFASMDLTRPFSIVTGAIQGVASLIGGIFGNKSFLIPQEIFDQYDTFIDVLDKVIDREKELIETVTGAQAVMASDEALKAIEKQEDATRRLAKAYLASREKGKKSYGVRTERELRGYKDEIEAAGFNWKKLYGTGRMEGLFDMSAEDIKDFQKRLPEVWAHLDEKTREYLETIVECGEKTEEVESALKEAATGITFDSLKSELLDFLNDMDSTFDDVAGNFEDTMMNAINRVIATGLDEDLSNWYKDFSERMEDGNLSEAEREALRREYERIYNEALQKRNAAYEAAGIDPSKQDAREASKKGIAMASQDSVDENNGRLTVIQGHTYNILENVKLMLPPLAATAENTAGIRAGMDALRANSGEILEHLAGIRDNTAYCRRLEPIEADIRGMKSILDSINTKGLAIRK